MTNITSTWEPCTVRVETHTETGAPLIVEGVPARKRKTTGEVFYDPEDALRIHYAQLAKKAGLDEPRDFAIMAVLGASAYSFKTPNVPYHYHLNKMLFYQWQHLDQQGLGNAFPHDEFVADRKGPVPVNIEEDLERLEKDGLIEPRKWPTGKQHQPVPVRLSKKGEKVAATILGEAEPWIAKTSAQVKTDLILLSPADLRAKVHTEYPQYRREYVEIDDA